MKTIRIGGVPLLIKDYYCSQDETYIEKKDGKLWNRNMLIPVTAQSTMEMMNFTFTDFFMAILFFCIIQFPPQEKQPLNQRLLSVYLTSI